MFPTKETTLRLLKERKKENSTGEEYQTEK
jgi:hypothetical protein